MARWLHVGITVFMVAMLLGPLQARVLADGYPGSVDNGDVTRTLVYRPSGGLNNGTDIGSLNGGKDAFVIRNESPVTANTNYGSSPIHHTFNSNCNPWVAQSFFQWDVSALPAASEVSNVTMVLYHRIFRSYGWPYQIPATTMNVRAVAQPWDEMTITFNSQPAVAQPVLASVNIPTAVSPNACEGYVEIDITGLYKEWRSGARPNHGIAYSRLQSFCENANASYVYSSDHPDVEKRPGLKITYVATPSDTTAPVIVPVVSGVLGDEGWHTGDVAVSWLVSDAESPVVTMTGCGSSLVAADTAGMEFTCTATSAGGTASQSVEVKRDATAPVVSYIGNAGTYAVDETVNISCTASDGLSGVASSTCQSISGPAYAFSLGSNVYSASATDRAGNNGSASTGFAVTVTSGSVSNLTARFVTKAGILRSLQAKLAAAQSASDRGNNNAKRGALSAFANEVAAQSGKALTSEQADILISLAGQI